MPYTYSTSTTAADPGSGYLRFNTDPLSSNPTECYVSENGNDGRGVINVLTSLTSSTSENKSFIVLYKTTDQSVNIKFYVTGQTDNGTWRTLNISYLDRDGWLNANNDDDMYFTISFIADRGYVGGSGSTWLFDDTHAATDPGATYLKIDQDIGTIDPRPSAVYISQTDSNNKLVDNLILSLDDSTNTNKSQINIFSTTDPGDNIKLYVTSVTDNTGWYTLACTYIDHDGSQFAADTELYMNVSYIGDKGNAGSGVANYGNFYFTNATVKSLSSGVNALTGFTSGLSVNTTFTVDATDGDYIEIDVAGDYKIECTCSIQSDTASVTFGCNLYTNNTIDNNNKWEIDIPTANEYHSASFSTMLTLAINDKLHLKLNSSTGSVDATFQHFNFNVISLG